MQIQSTVSTSSDLFSLGLVVAAIFNQGRPLIQAGHSNPNYTKQMEMVNRFFFLFVIFWPLFCVGWMAIEFDLSLLAERPSTQRPSFASRGLSRSPGAFTEPRFAQTTHGPAAFLNQILQVIVNHLVSIGSSVQSKEPASLPNQLRQFRPHGLHRIYYSLGLYKLLSRLWQL